MSDEVNDFLTSSGAPSAKFYAKGDMITGFIIAAQLRDQTDITTGEVKRFPSGDPMKQVVITLQTEEAEDEEDDGVRRVFAKGAMLGAIRNAVGKAGLRAGGKLRVKYTGDGEPSKKGFNPPKQYKAWYKPPEPQAQNLEERLNAPDDEPDGEAPFE